MNIQSNNFSTDFYSLALTNDQVSLEEVNQLFARVHSALHSPPSIEDRRRLPKNSLPQTLLISYVPLIIIFIIISYFPKGTFTAEEAIFMGLIGGNFFMLSILWPDMNEGFKAHPVDLKFEKCQDIVDEHNENLRGRGLKWNLHAGFPYVIELTKDLDKGMKEFQIESKEKITFILNKGRYSKDFYKPEMTDGRISHEEMYEFLFQINAERRRPLAKLNPAFLVVSLVLSVSVLSVLQISNSLPEFCSSPLVVIVLGIFIIGITACPYILINSKYKKKFRTEFKADFQRFINELNETLRSRGLKWHLLDQFPYSIELCKDSKNQNLSHQQNNPNNMHAHENEKKYM